MTKTIVTSSIRALVNQMNELGITRELTLDGGLVKDGNQWILIYFE